MDKIQRPKKASRNERSYLTNENYQDYVNPQLESIYDKLDEIVSGTKELVYEIKLTEESTYLATDLNRGKLSLGEDVDKAHFEFEAEIFSNAKANLDFNINDKNTGFFYNKIGLNGNTQGTVTPDGYYAFNENWIYLGTLSNLAEYPTIVNGKIKLHDGVVKMAYFDIEVNNPVVESYSMNFIKGLNTETMTDINKFVFWFQGGFKFRAGSTLKVWKVYD